MTESKGFLGTLFDFSFRTFLTSKVIKFIYVVSMILVALETIGWIAVAFNYSTALGALSLLIFGPIYFVLAMLWVRIVLELIIVFFRIHEDVREINAVAGKTAPASAPAPPRPEAGPAVAPA